MKIMDEPKIPGKALSMTIQIIVSDSRCLKFATHYLAARLTDWMHEQGIVACQDKQCPTIVSANTSEWEIKL
jgi:hypothetical protein